MDGVIRLSLRAKRGNLLEACVVVTAKRSPRRCAPRDDVLAVVVRFEFNVRPTLGMRRNMLGLGSLNMRWPAGGLYYLKLPGRKLFGQQHHISIFRVCKYQIEFGISIHIANGNAVGIKLAFHFHPMELVIT